MSENQSQADLIPPGRQIGSKAAYARHRGCAPSAVTRAIQDRRIPVLMIDGRAMIDFAAADAAWAVSTRPRIDAPGPSAPRGPLLDADQSANMDALARARLVREEAAGQLLALRLDREAGALVDRGEVDLVMADIGASLQATLGDVPARIAPRLVGRPLDEIARTLTETLERALNDIADKMEAFSAGPPQGCLSLAPLGGLDLINPDPLPEVAP